MNLPVNAPGVYISDGTLRCMECKELVPAGGFVAVDQYGATTCDLHDSAYRNAVTRSACMLAVLQHRDLSGFAPGLVEECQDAVWIWSA